MCNTRLQDHPRYHQEEKQINKLTIVENLHTKWSWLLLQNFHLYELVFGWCVVQLRQYEVNLGWVIGRESANVITGVVHEFRSTLCVQRHKYCLTAEKIVSFKLILKYIKCSWGFERQRHSNDKRIPCISDKM